MIQCMMFDFRLHYKCIRTYKYITTDLCFRPNQNIQFPMLEFRYHRKCIRIYKQVSTDLCFHPRNNEYLILHFRLHHKRIQF